MPLTGYSLFARAHPSLVSELVELRREWQAALRRVQVRPRTRQHHDVRRLLRAKHLHRYFAFEALRRLHRLGNASRETIETLAGEFDPFRPVAGEAVVMRSVSPRPGHNRIVHDFGPIRRMHQFAVNELLRSLHPPPERQKLFNGGMPKALEAIEAAWHEGATHACEVDFVDFYGSVRPDGLADLMRPLPGSVTRHVVWDEALREQSCVIMRSPVSCPAPTPEMPDGLALGSATSPMVGEVIIARLLAAAQLTHVITYADNLFIYGCSEGEVSARLKRLEDGIASADFGISGLSFRDSGIRTFEEVPYGGDNDARITTPSIEGVEFAGHRCLRVGEGFAWAPTGRKQAAYQISALDHVRVDELDRAITRVANWRRYYQRWEDGDLYEARYIAELKAKRFFVEQSPRNFTEAVAAVCSAYLAWNGLSAPEEFLPDFHEGMLAAVHKRLQMVKGVARLTNGETIAATARAPL